MTSLSAHTQRRGLKPAPGIGAQVPARPHLAPGAAGSHTRWVSNVAGGTVVEELGVHEPPVAGPATAFNPIGGMPPLIPPRHVDEIIVKLPADAVQLASLKICNVLGVHDCPAGGPHVQGHMAG